MGTGDRPRRSGELAALRAALYLVLAVSVVRLALAGSPAIPDGAFQGPIAGLTLAVALAGLAASARRE